MRVFSPAERFAAAEMARADLYFCSRWMFQQRKGYAWQRARQHKLICDALMRVFRGECKRLIINVPPRYSKTELAVTNFIAWAMGQVPDAEFIHTSYSAALAVNNSVGIRTLVQHEAYREIFPKLVLANEAGNHWKTTAGGVMYAIRRPDPWPNTFGFHEFFHAATVLAAICHHVAIWLALFPG